MPVIWSNDGPYWWRSRRGYVLWPLAMGIAFCAFGLWSGSVYEHNQAVFRAQALPTKAVIDRIYTSAPAQGYSAPTFDEYALVHLIGLGQRAPARILLATNCSGICVPTHRVGQVLTVDYNPANPSYAQLPTRLAGPSANLLYALVTFGVLGVAFLGAAVVNIVTA